jgi:hypothetical protein
MAGFFMTKLTQKQKKLIKELDLISTLLGLNYKDIQKLEDVDTRTPYLESVENQIIRSEVIMDYTFLDECMSQIICDYFFGSKKGNIRLWKTKKFQRFNYYVIEKLYLLNKLDIVKELIKLPSDIIEFIYKINDLRNGLAHSFFPENLRRNKPIYKGKSIFSFQGFEIFVQDYEKVNDFFFQKAFKVNLSKYS